MTYRRLHITLCIVTFAALACGTLPLAESPKTGNIATSTAAPDPVTVIAYKVNVRYAPAGRVTGVLSRGDMVDVEGCWNGWCKTNKGWIWQGCLSIAPEGVECQSR